MTFRGDLGQGESMQLNSSLFFRHVRRFWRDHQALKPRVVVAVSGGADSRLLWEFAQWLLQIGELSGVRAVGVHHHTRPGQDQELEAMEWLARQRGWSWQTLHYQDARPSADVENVLRQGRHRLLRQYLAAGEELWLGHHLDDSWEWAQLQQARSSEVRAGLGIPLKNGALWRPFLCVSKAQILRELRRRGITWSEDPSNHTSGYARALFRREWHGKLRQHHPQFLKHYARRSQRLAESLGVALKPLSHGAVFSHPQARLLQGPLSEQQLLRAVKAVGKGTRGSLTREIPKLLRASRAGKKGPFLLSGGVRVVAYDAWLLVMGPDFRAADTDTGVTGFTPWTRAAFESQVRAALRHGLLQHAPFWVSFDPEQKHRNVLVASGRDPLWQTVTGRRERAVMHAAKLLARWKDPQQVLWLSPLWPLQPTEGRV